ncbi:MAG: ABC transporter permease [Bryobacterales bacterium]|nr:ABC transporter permease [Bryobacterales bacterium]MBV9401038.1 ABC transporter permease [Bryobacterales bacterium]
MGALLQDLRYATRTLLRAPGFTAVAVATLALGIGANAAIFSLVDSVLIKPLPYRDPSRLVIAWDSYLPQDSFVPAFPKIGVSPRELDLWQSQNDIFQDTAWYRYVPSEFSLIPPHSGALSVRGDFFSTDFLRVMGVAPVLGRAFADHEPPNSVLLSEHIWRTGFASDPGIVGKTIRLNDDGFTVIGVMAADFKFPDWADVWLPPGPLIGDELTNPVRHAAGFIGRLNRGVTMQQAETRLTALSSRLVADNPKTSTGWGMRVSALQDDLTANIRSALLMLFGAVALVLLTACSNVANLMLARANGRSREIATRGALGAGAWRLTRQLLTESVLLAVLGGAAGLGFAELGLRLLSPVETQLDLRVVAYLLTISLATGLIFGLAPILQALRGDTNVILKATSVTRGASGMPSALVVAEFALAMVLIAAAAILVNGFVRLVHVNPGFNPRGLLTMRIAFPRSRKPDILFRGIEQRVKQIPGVDRFASINVLPLNPDHGNAGRFNVPGNPLINPDSLPAAQLRLVSPDYFAAMRIPIESGRAFEERDLTQPVVIVNRTMANRFWPGKNAVGEKFITGPWGTNPTWSTIIGVAGDVKQFGLDAESSLDEYFPSLFPATILIHTSGHPESLIAPVYAAIQAIDPELPVSEIRTMDQLVDDSAASRRWTMTLLASFATLAMVLALIGIYGVLSWSVTRRTKEIGIRVALGASSREVTREILVQGIRLSALGLAIGVVSALALSRFWASRVFEVTAADPLIYSGAAAVMFAVALAACYLPARRAGRVDPLTALRWE